MLKKSYDWRTFVHEVGEQLEIPTYLKVLQLSQAMLESGRGTSTLFLEHGNPFGMKYCAEMMVIAESVLFTTNSGETDRFCGFLNEQSAVIGYWVFLNRKVYTGWREQRDAISTLRHIVNCGYAGQNEQAKKTYIEKCSRLFPEAAHILRVI